MRYVYSGTITATPQPKNGQFEIEVKFGDPGITLEGGPIDYGAVRKVYDTLADLVLTQAKSRGYPDEQVLVFDARMSAEPLAYAFRA